MAITRMDGDLVVGGTISGATLVPSDGTVTDAKFSSVSGSELDADKQQHLYRLHHDFGFDWDATPSGSVEKIVFRARAAGTIREVGALLSDTGTSTDIDFDLQKAVAGSTSFSTVLTGVVNITHGDTDNTASTATISSPTLAAGDVLRLDMAVTSATGALGPLAYVELEELPA